MDQLAEARVIISKFLQYRRTVPARVGVLDPRAVVDAWTRRGEPLDHGVIVFRLEWLR
jgi:hypothetical protein